MRKVLIVLSLLAFWAALRRFLEAVEDAEMDAAALKMYQQVRDNPDRRTFTLEEVDAFVEELSHGR